MKEAPNVVCIRKILFVFRKVYNTKHLANPFIQLLY